MQMDSRKLDFGLNGMSIGDGDGKIEVAEASLKGFDWSSTIKGISEIIALDETQIETFQFNRLIPELGRVRVGGINVDMAAPEKTEEETTGTPERIKFSLKNFEMGLTKPFNGIPTDIEIRQDELTLPIPADSEEEVFVEARKLGLETLAFLWPCGLLGRTEQQSGDPRHLAQQQGFRQRQFCRSGKRLYRRVLLF